MLTPVDLTMISLVWGHTVGQLGPWWTAHVFRSCDETCPWCFLGEQKEEEFNDDFKTELDGPGNC